MSGQATLKPGQVVLQEADRFACEALSAFDHKSSMFDTAEKRFKGGLNFVDATSQFQQKVRILLGRLEQNNESMGQVKR